MLEVFKGISKFTVNIKIVSFTKRPPRENLEYTEDMKKHSRQYLPKLAMKHL